MIWILLQRFGTALVPWGQLHLKNKQYATDFEPINKDCGCWTCKHYTRAYINCLLGREEVACHLLTLHNIYYQVSYRKICHLFINNNSKSKINCLYEHYFLLSWVKFLSAWKFKKIINLSSQTVKNYNGNCHYFNRDDCIALFHHCSFNTKFEWTGCKMKAKQPFKT